MWMGALASLAVLAGGPPAASVAGVHPPVLGDWEGSGPEGLPLSFSLGRVRGRVTIRDLTVGDPLRCPGRLAPTNAFGYAPTTYIGAGSPPVVRINWHPDDVVIRVGRGAPFSPELDGRLLSSHRMTLSEPAPVGESAGCGWSTKRLTWRVAPARRVAVVAGNWTGTVTVPGGSATVSVRVSAAGRIVELFSVVARCGGGEASFGVGPAAVGEFIAANGVFADASRPGAFQGRFLSPVTLAGTVSANPLGCGGAGPFPFAAHPG